jgi:hypothetical protein
MNFLLSKLSVVSARKMQGYHVISFSLKKSDVVDLDFGGDSLADLFISNEEDDDDEDDDEDDDDDEEEEDRVKDKFLSLPTFPGIYKNRQNYPVQDEDLVVSVISCPTEDVLGHRFILWPRESTECTKGIEWIDVEWIVETPDGHVSPLQKKQILKSVTKAFAPPSDMDYRPLSHKRACELHVFPLFGEEEAAATSKGKDLRVLSLSNRSVKNTISTLWYAGHS